MKEQNREITEIERMAIDIDKRFYEAEIKQTLPKKHPSIVKAEALYNAGYRKQKDGEWKKHFASYECTVCKQEFCVSEYAEDYDPIEDYDLHFCPNCGAKMKGGAE